MSMQGIAIAHGARLDRSSASEPVLVMQPVLINSSVTSSEPLTEEHEAVAKKHGILRGRENAEPRRPHVLTWQWQHARTGENQSR